MHKPWNRTEARVSLNYLVIKADLPSDLCLNSYVITMASSTKADFIDLGIAIMNEGLATIGSIIVEAVRSQSEDVIAAYDYSGVFLAEANRNLINRYLDSSISCVPTSQ